VESRRFSNILRIKKDLPSFSSSISEYYLVKEKKDNLSQQEIGTRRIDDALVNIREFIIEKRFPDALSELNSTFGLIEDIYKINQTLKEISVSILELKSAGIDTRNADSLYNLSVQEFQFENYEKSKSLAEETQKALKDIEQKNLVSAVFAKANAKFNIIQFLKDNWIYIILFSLLGYFTIRIVIFFSGYFTLERRIKSLSAERKAILRQIRNIELGYFKKDTIDKQTYLGQRESYESRLNYIEVNLPKSEQEFEKKKKRLASFNIMKKTKDEPIKK
jgi:hypothetical protein